MKIIRCPICGYQHYGQNSRWVEIANKRVDEKARFFNIKDSEIIKEMRYLFYYLIAHELFSVSLFVNPEDYKEWKRKYVPQLYEELDLSGFGFKRLKMLVEKIGYHPQTIITWKEEENKMELKPYAEKLKISDLSGRKLKKELGLERALKPGATYLFYDKNLKKWRWCGDTAHVPEEDIKYNVKKLYEIYNKYKDQVEGAFGICKDYDTDYVYILTTKTPHAEDYKKLKKENVGILEESVGGVMKRCYYGIHDFEPEHGQKLSIKEAIKLALE